MHNKMKHQPTASTVVGKNHEKSFRQLTIISSISLPDGIPLPSCLFSRIARKMYQLYKKVYKMKKYAASPQLNFCHQDQDILLMQPKLTDFRSKCVTEKAADSSIHSLFFAVTIRAMRLLKLIKQSHYQSTFQVPIWHLENYPLLFCETSLTRYDSPIVHQCLIVFFHTKLVHTQEVDLSEQDTPNNLQPS